MRGTGAEENCCKNACRVMADSAQEGVFVCVEGAVLRSPCIHIYTTLVTIAPEIPWCI